MYLNFDSGSPKNIVSPPSRAHFVLGLTFPLYILALIFVSARILVKAKLGKFGAEDVLIFLSSCLALALLVATSIACKYGFGLHTRDVQPEWILPYGIFNYVTIAICTLCFYTTKASMVVFYLHLTTEPRFRTIIYISITYLTLSFGGVTLLNLLGCSPISGAWDRRLETHSVCVTTTAFYYYSVVNNVVTDILMILLPIPILVRLRLRWLVKLQLVGMFSMGFLITAVSSVSLWKMQVSISGSDIIWDGAYSWMWVLVELLVGIMTACMPAINLFVKWVRGQKVEQGSPEDDTIGGGGRRGRRNGGLQESKDSVEVDIGEVVGESNPGVGLEMKMWIEGASASGIRSGNGGMV